MIKGNQMVLKEMSNCDMYRAYVIIELYTPDEKCTVEQKLSTKLNQSYIVSHKTYMIFETSKQCL